VVLEFICAVRHEIETFCSFFVTLMNVGVLSLFGQFAALASKFNLELLQSQYPNLYPVVTGLLSASDDRRCTK